MIYGTSVTYKDPLVTLPMKPQRLCGCLYQWLIFGENLFYGLQFVFLARELKIKSTFQRAFEFYLGIKGRRTELEIFVNMALILLYICSQVLLPCLI
jgi:hypothetical protein